MATDTELAALVQRKLAEGFADAGARAQAHALLLRMPDYCREPSRVQLGCLFLAQGRLDELAEAVGLANRDYRDLLVAAEYSRQFGLDPQEEPAAYKLAQSADAEAYRSWLEQGTVAERGPGKTKK